MAPESSVDALHARLMASSVAPVTCTFAGTLGALRSGCLGRAAAAAGAARATASVTHALSRQTFPDPYM
jgi:hypothetical protein